VTARASGRGPRSHVEQGPPDKIFAAADNARVREFVATISGHR